jgi:hypothetical protein
MDNETTSIAAGLRDADQRLHASQSALARAAASSGGRGADAAMAQTARAAIFDEALLAALHARLAEAKAVTK